MASTDTQQHTEPALALEGLTKIYRQSHLGRVRLSRGVEDLNLKVPQGEVFGVLGPNGSGKTTTIKLCLSLLFPTRGQVKIFGRPAQDPASRNLLGYLPEVPYFYKFLTAREVLNFYGQLSGVSAGERKDRLEQVLIKVRMQEHAHRPMRQYSKGMLQRVGLAQALLHDPRLLILDEVISGLDPLGLRETRELLLDLKEAGKTIFFSSHSLSEVEKICDRVGIIFKGKLARVITKQEWADRPGSLEKMFVDIATAEGPAEVR